MKQLNKQSTNMKGRQKKYPRTIVTGVILLLIAISLFMTGCDLLRGEDEDSSTPQEKALARLHQATEQYLDVEAAIADGFQAPFGCFDPNPDHPGTVGVPYVELDRANDTDIVLEKPEVLFYEPQKNGELRLLGSEPVVPIALWDSTHSEPPSMFGREFHKNDGLYGLHMWVWKENPEGVLAFEHPEVSCEYFEEEQ